jgi:flagellar biosynthesis protein FlhB
MMTDEDYGGGGPKVKKKTSTRAFLPVIGFVLMLAFGAIAYVLGPILHTQFGTQLGMADIAAQLQLPPAQVGSIFFGVVVFLLLVLFGGLLLSAFSPKQRINVHEQDMDKERKQKQMEDRMKKKRMEQSRVKMAQERKASAKDNDLSRRK